MFESRLKVAVEAAYRKPSMQQQQQRLGEQLLSREPSQIHGNAIVAGPDGMSDLNTLLTMGRVGFGEGVSATG